MLKKALEINPQNNPDESALSKPLEPSSLISIQPKPNLPLIEHDEARETPKNSERNLPPGYVIVPCSAPGQPEAFVCKVCQHYSGDVFSVNAVSIGYAFTYL